MSTVEDDNKSFHPDHTDSTADLIIECKDGVKFRVHSFLLMAHSEYFRNMPSYSDDAVVHSEKLVHLDCDSTGFAVLLSLINRTREHTSYSWVELLWALKIGEGYHFIHLPDLIHQPASHCLVGFNAPTVFQFAASHGFLDLAKHAIVKLADSNFAHYGPKDIQMSFFDKVAPRYAAALVVALSQHPSTSGLDRHTKWQKVSAAFEVSG